MTGMESSSTLLDVGAIAERLDITREAAFDLMFVSRELPIVFTDDQHGVPEEAVEAYRHSHR